MLRDLRGMGVGGGKVHRKVKAELSDPHRRSWLFLHFSSVSSVAQLCPTAACQASLSITNSQSLIKLTSVESVMLSNYLILCHPLLFLPSIFPSIRVFSNDSALHIRCQSTEASASVSVLPINIQGRFLFRLAGLTSLQSKGLSRVFSNTNTTVQKHQFFSAQLSLWSNSHIHI